MYDNLLHVECLETQLHTYTSLTTDDADLLQNAQISKPISDIQLRNCKLLTSFHFPCNTRIKPKCNEIVFGFNFPSRQKKLI